MKTTNYPIYVVMPERKIDGNILTSSHAWYIMHGQKNIVHPILYDN